MKLFQFCMFSVLMLLLRAVQQVSLVVQGRWAHGHCILQIPRLMQIRHWVSWGCKVQCSDNERLYLHLIRVEGECRNYGMGHQLTSRHCWHSAYKRQTEALSGSAGPDPHHVAA